MNDVREQKDLVVLVPDRNIEATIAAILSRPQALGIRAVTYDIYRHGRDPGCLREAHSFLRMFSWSHRYALVVFDYEGCGSDRPPAELIGQVEGNLAVSGWGEQCCAVIIEPEVEAWGWCSRAHLAAALAWTSMEEFEQWLVAQRFVAQAGATPSRPKEALESALARIRSPRSSSLYAQLASKISLDRCTEPSFVRMRETLRVWFGERQCWSGMDDEPR